MICHVTIMTEDMENSVRFYDWLLGLPVARSFDIPNGRITFLGSEETKLEFIYRDSYKRSGDANGITVGFAVSDLDDKMKMLDDKNIAHSPVISPNPASRFCTLADPNGIQIQLFESKA